MQITKITLDTKLKKGDIIVLLGYYYKVLATLEDLIFLSDAWKTEKEKDECENMANSSITIQQLVSNEYSLVTPEWSVDDLKDGDKYWYLNSCGEALKEDLYCKNIYDFRKKTNNIFPTEEKAEARLKKIMR